MATYSTHCALLAESYLKISKLSLWIKFLVLLIISVLKVMFLKWCPTTPKHYNTRERRHTERDEGVPYRVGASNASEVCSHLSRDGGWGAVRQRRSFVQSSLKRLVFDFLPVGVGNSAALCELVRSPRPTVLPFFADPWQQICSNDIVSSWVITHNSDGHTPHCCRNRGERRITLKH